MKALMSIIQLRKRNWLKSNILRPKMYTGDSDSAIGSDVESGSTSLSESIYNYRREHGRTYHAYKDGKYIFPNDEREADRLDLQHHIFRLTFGNRLFFSPLQNPKHCLDVGTGTGIWAEEFAEDFPYCQVTGIDLSPDQPTLVPPNLKFMIDDAEDLWLLAEFLPPSISEPRAWWMARSTRLRPAG
ncbi:hypothetical protein KC316_g20111 [Hortaea werneckii]|nr:hypothetical protein KC316_g20111 [Hortaea werneckii]